jgi:hypothetical protein
MEPKRRDNNVGEKENIFLMQYEHVVVTLQMLKLYSEASQKVILAPPT